MTDSHSNIHFFEPGSRYITKAIHLLEDGTQKIATSRRHRKGRGVLLVNQDGAVISSPGKKNPWLRLWAPSGLTWWVAVLFTIGSALFSLGGYAITFPESTPKVLMTGMTLDWIFFIGSIVFTSAAYCQLLESINAGDSEGLHEQKSIPSKFQWIAWHPKRIGYMASLIQLIGTVMFNFNTGNVLLVK